MSDTTFAEKEPSLERQPLFNIPWVVLALLAVLWLVYAAQVVFGEDVAVWSVFGFSFIPRRLGGGEAIPQLPGSAYWSFLSYALLHADWKHLLLNSFWFVIFGTIVARAFGPLRFLVLAAVAAAAGALGTLLLHWGEIIFLVGASGMVSGMTAAAIPIMYGTGSKVGLQSLSETLSVAGLLSNGRAMMFLFVWLGLQLLTGTSSLLTNAAFIEERPIAWEAHIGGFIAGLLVFFVMRATSSSSKHHN